MISDAIELSQKLEVVNSDESEQLEFIQKGIKTIQKVMNEQRDQIPFVIKQVE